MASEYQKQQKITDLSRDFHKAYESLESLRIQQKLSETNVKENQHLERLTYQSYRAGKSRYLDVQDANLKLFEAEVTSALIGSQVLLQIATLDYLSNN